MSNQTQAISRLLTKHQRRVLAAMLALDHPEGSVWLRSEIGSVVHGKSLGLTIDCMAHLHASGMISPESEIVVQIVRDRVCRCGCDRWRLTDSGRQVAKTFKVAWSRESQFYVEDVVDRSLPGRK